VASAQLITEADAWSAGRLKAADDEAVRRCVCGCRRIRDEGCALSPRRRRRNILEETKADWGFEAAIRYGRLILAAVTAIGESPDLPGSRSIPRVREVRAFHLQWARRLVGLEHRVGTPRHLVLYRVA
jgi:plasmid stabilization system protein ParE